MASAEEPCETLPAWNCGRATWRSLRVPPLTLGGGGATWLAAVMPSMARLSGERPPTSTGGGTTSGSPRLRQTVRSFVTPRRRRRDHGRRPACCRLRRLRAFAAWAH